MITVVLNKVAPIPPLLGVNCFWVTGTRFAGARCLSMRSWHWARLLGLLVVFLAIEAGARILAEEPKVEGKRLGEWVSEVVDFPQRYCEPRGAAARAIKAFGSNSLPYLVKQIQAEGLPEEEANLQRYHAVVGFAVLGEDASQAANLLEPLLPVLANCEGNGLTTVFTYLGAEGMAVLARGLSSRDPQVRYQICGSLLFLGGELGSTNATIDARARFERDAAIVLPVLRNTVRDPAEKIAKAACMALGTMGVDPKLVVPVLNEVMQDPAQPEAVRSSAARNIGVSVFCAKAEPSPFVPLLLREWTGTNTPLSVRGGALSGLHQFARLGSAEALRIVREASVGDDPELKRSAVLYLETIRKEAGLSRSTP